MMSTRLGRSLSQHSGDILETSLNSLRTGSNLSLTTVFKGAS
jgi:hypothetical protein